MTEQICSMNDLSLQSDGVLLKLAMENSNISTDQLGFDPNDFDDNDSGKGGDSCDEFSPDQISSTSQNILSLFENSSVIDDVALRVKMQNHGAWVPFSFVCNSYRCLQAVNPALVRHCIQKMPDIFEVKDKKFRRKEMLPDVERIVYQRSIILISKMGKLDYTDVKPIMKQIISHHSLLEGAHFRMMSTGEKNYPRDVGILVKKCGESLQSACFVWLELPAQGDVKSAFRLLCESQDESIAALREKFSPHLLSNLIHSNGLRKRGVTVSVVESNAVSGAGGCWAGGPVQSRKSGESRNHNSNSINGGNNSRFGFNNSGSRTGSTTQLDWAGVRGSHGADNTNRHTVGEVQMLNLGSGASTAASTVPPVASSCMRARASHLLNMHLTPLNLSPVTASGDSGNHSGGSSGRPQRVRLANSESSSNISPTNLDASVKPLYKTGELYNRSSFTKSSNSLVTVIRQPRGPSGDAGFVQFCF